MVHEFRQTYPHLAIFSSTAEPAHIAEFMKGFASWNQSGIASGVASPDLTDAELVGLANLRNGKLGGADFHGAHLVGADLLGAQLRAAKFQGADLRKVQLADANLFRLPTLGRLTILLQKTMLELSVVEKRMAEAFEELGKQDPKQSRLPSSNFRILSAKSARRKLLTAHIPI